MDNGWVKLHRKLWKNPRSKDPEWVAVWVYLLCQATHQTMDVVWKGKQMKLKPGQVITGQRKIADSTGINRSKVRRVLEWLKIDHQIDQQTSNANSLITVIKWNSYQSTDPQTDQRPTHDRPTTDPRPTTNKKYKNNKNEEEVPRAREGILGWVDMIRGARPEFVRLNEMTLEAMVKTAVQSGKDVETNVQDFVIDAANMFDAPEKPTAMLRRYLDFERHESGFGEKKIGGVRAVIARDADEPMENLRLGKMK